MFKRHLKQSLLLLIIASTAVTIAEIAARYMGFGEPPLAILDDKIEYYLAPSRSYSRFGHDILINRYSMRSDDVDMLAVGPRVTFSLFGDSVVYGNRLDQADTLPAQLEKRLAYSRNYQKALVNSVAASGWGPENLVEFYRRFGPFPGNTAWILQSTHDMVDVGHLVDKSFPYRTVSPFNALHDLTLSTWHWAGLNILPNRVDPIKYEEKRRRADIALQALIMTLKTDYARVILVFHATRGEAIDGETQGLLHYRAVAKEQAVDFISTMDLYSRAYKSHNPPHYDDIHLNKEGARMLSELLAADVGPAD
jgi:hypothetical protein